MRMPARFANQAGPEELRTGVSEPVQLGFGSAEGEDVD
jgi:hypothetical protein